MTESLIDTSTPVRDAEQCRLRFGHSLRRTKTEADLDWCFARSKFQRAENVEHHRFVPI